MQPKNAAYDAAPEKGGFSTMASLRDTVKAVSYTHLDVYKRQAWHSVLRRRAKPNTIPDRSPRAILLGGLFVWG